MSRSVRKERGQAMVMTLIFAVAIVLIALIVFRSGRLTSDKMELQNAADAMAYSASVVEARDLNFASYMNRSVIANEVAIGQAVGLASWAFHWNSIGEWLLEYNKYLSGPTAGFSNSILQPASAVFTVPGSKLPVSFVPLLSSYAKGMSSINHYANKAYSIATMIHHVATIASVVGVLDEIRDDSAPDDAVISDFGLMSLVGHLVTYNAEFTKMYDPTKYAAVADFQDDLTGDTDAGGYGRLSAMIHNSGDPFTKGWHNPQYNADDSLNGRGWNFRLFEQMANYGLLPFLPFETPFFFPPVFPGTLTADLDDSGNIRFDFNSALDLSFDSGFLSGGIGYELDFALWFGIGMERQGGSELRAVIPITGGNTNEVAGERFSWSSADTTRAYMNIGAEFYARIYALLTADFGLFEVSAGADAEASAILAVDGENEGLEFGATLSVALFGVDVIDLDLTICTVDTCPFPASLPIGTGFAQAAKTAQALTSAPSHLGTEKLGTGPVTPESYGEAANTILPWNYPPSPVAGAGYTGTAAGVYFQPPLVLPRSRNVGTSYGGLPYYIDTTDTVSLFGSGGPFLIMGLRIDEDDFEDRDNDGNPDPQPTGNFALDEDFSNDRMSVIAKSEVYFKRPLDLTQYARGDGYVEHGSAFNPYWQARLVDTSHADRVVALLIEHNEVAQSGVSTPILSVVSDVLAWMQGFIPGDLIPR